MKNMRRSSETSTLQGIRLRKLELLEDSTLSLFLPIQDLVALKEEHHVGKEKAEVRVKEKEKVVESIEDHQEAPAHVEAEEKAKEVELYHLRRDHE